jgi:hypothetical protein
MFDFELSQMEMEAVTALQPAGAAPRRTCPDPATVL